VARLAAAAASASLPRIVLHSVASGFCAQRASRPVRLDAAFVRLSTTFLFSSAIAARWDSCQTPALLVFVVSPAPRRFTSTCADVRVCTIGTTTPKLSLRVIPYSSAIGVVTTRASLRTSRRPNVKRCAGFCVSVFRPPSMGEILGSCRGPSESVDSGSPSPMVALSPNRLSWRSHTLPTESRTHPPGIGIASSVWLSVAGACAAVERSA
jgi:hypothetical protein